jgi:hypothetical protein
MQRRIEMYQKIEVKEKGKSMTMPPDKKIEERKEASWGTRGSK